MLSILRGSDSFIPLIMPKVLKVLKVLKYKYLECYLCVFSSLTISSNGGFTTVLLVYK